MGSATAIFDEERVQEFLLEASGVDALVVLGYADGPGEYDAAMEGWRGEAGAEV